MLKWPQNRKLYHIILIFGFLKMAVIVQNINFFIMKPIEILNDPFACKLEVMLGSFGQRTHAVEMQGMMDTKVTDYFVRK
jgi:hypothetical protein